MHNPINVKTELKNVIFSAVVGFIFVIAIIAVLLFYEPVYAQAPDVPEHIAVGLKYGSSAVAGGSISSGEPLIFGTIESGRFTQISDLDNNKEVSFSCQGSKITIIGANGSLLEEFSGDNTYIIYPQNYEMSVPVKYNESEYRGGIILKPVSGGKANVINFLKTEDYLRGMLNGEMGYSSPIEALKAQAVSARNFAVVKQNAHQSDGFDVCASTHCQVYSGISAEYEKTDQAIKETEGILMYSAGSVVEAYYSKNSGGYTNNSEDVWTATLAYLRAVKDSYSPDYPWAATFTTSELRAKLEGAGNSVGDIKSVQVKSRSVSGSVLELEISGSNGKATFKKEQIRTFFGMSVIKSLKFGFGSVPETPFDTVKLTVLGSGGESAVTDSLYAIDKSGVKTRINIENMMLICANGTYKTGEADTAASNTADIADISGGKVTFTGSGYGHGVGMSQDGAINMANQGKKFDEILKFYYTNVEIK